VSWITAILVYAVIWWLVLFCVLPFGIRPSPEGDVGEAAGAPANPRLPLRLLVTTGIAAVVFLVFYLIVQSGWISFRTPE
jgi:predicted secreted protein